MAQNPWELGKSLGLKDFQIENIRQKAESNTPMQTPTDQKNQLYNAFQDYYKGLVVEKAKSGEGLSRPNEWKQSIYNQASLNLNPNDKAYYQTDNIMRRQRADSNENLARFDRYLQKSAEAQISSAEAGFANARDQQISELQKMLNDAVYSGRMSVKEAERQFEEQVKAINAQAYQDQEVTRHNAQAMGIQNSQQMLGMMASDQARTQSLKSNAMSERDLKIFEINNRIQALKSATAIDIANVNANYNNAVTQAQGQIMADMYNQQYNTRLNEYNRLQNAQLGLDQVGLSQRYAQDNMALEQAYALERMNAQQRHTLEQFAVQHGYDLQKMDINQRYQLAQMATQYGYDLGLQEHRQRWQSSENARDRSWQTSERIASQGWQSSENALNRAHDFAFATHKNTLDMENENTLYRRQLEREYRAYNVPGSTEYKLRTAQEKAGINSAVTQQMLGMLNEVQMSHVANLLNSLPKVSSKRTQSEISAYNSAVADVNAQLKQMLPAELYEKFRVPTIQASGTATTKNEDKLNAYNRILRMLE